MGTSFYILALFTLTFGFLAMSLKKLVHCALCLALTFFGVAGLYLHINAGFIAFAQVFVYVGAVAILIVFAILLTRSAEEKSSPRGGFVPGILAALLIGGILVSVIASSRFALRSVEATAPPVRELGRALMTTHVVPLEFIGLLLTVALLGGVVLAMREHPAENKESQP